MKKYFLLLGLGLGLISNVYANDWFLQAGLHAGGDKLAGVTFTNGTSSSIYAGGLLSLDGGVNLDLTTNSQLRLAVGYKFDNISASNGSITFDRTTLDASWFYWVNSAWCLGVGVTQHLNPVLSGSGVTAGRVAFKDATGIVMEADFQLAGGMYWGGKFTSIEYETLSGSAKVNGNSAGILFGWRF